jgi:dienelactone hydrolase
MKIHLSCAEADPWIARDAVEKAAERFRAAGATVDLHVVPGNNHAIHAVDEEALRTQAPTPATKVAGYP